MSGANLTNLIIGVAVLALLLRRQLATRRLSESYRLSVILAVIGIVEFADFLKGHPSDDGGIAAAVVGSLVIAAVFGAVRALTVQVWRGEGGHLLRKGTWLTAVLWVLSLAAHLGYDDLVAGQTQSQSQRPLFALRGVGPRRHQFDLQLQFVAVGPDRGQPPAQIVVARRQQGVA